MTELAAAVLTLRPALPGTIQQWTGPIWRTWFLAQVADHDPALAESLQSGEHERRPYTVSSLMHSGRPGGRTLDVHPSQSYSIRITTLSSALTHVLLNDLLPSLPDTVIESEGMTWRIEQATAQDHPWANTATDAGLVQMHTLTTDALPRAVTLRFASPTTFRGPQGLLTPFPLPAMVFGSLLDHWNLFNDVQLHPDTRRFADACIEARRIRLRSNTVALALGEHTALIAGFRGTCRYALLRADRYWIGIVQTLAAYAFYAGVGLHTTMGMGQTQMLRAPVPVSQTPGPD